MATALPSNDITNDSDEVIEMFCEQCDEHGMNATASGFCMICQDYMCDMCLLYHTRYMPEHTQLDVNHMPQDFCTEKCDIHRNKVLKFYCNTCNGFACATCKQKSQGNCQYSHIPSLIQSNVVDIDTEVTALNETITNISKSLDEAKGEINKNLSEVVVQENEAKSEIEKGIKERKCDFKRQCAELIQSFDEEVDKIVNKLQAERQKKLNWLSEQSKIFEEKIDEGVKAVEDDLKITVGSDKTKLNTLAKDCKEISNDLRSLNDCLAVKQRSGRKSSLFIAAKKMKPVVSKCQEEIEKVKENNTISYFDVDSKNVILSSVPNRLTFNTFTFNRVEKPTHSNVVLIPKLCLSLETDKSSLTFTSLCLLSNNKLVVTNYKHSNLFVYNDLNENTKVDILPLVASPWDVTKISGQRVAVTFPDANIIQLLQPSIVRMNIKEINVGGTCHGIANTGDRLIVSFINPVQIKEIDFEGVVKKRIVNPSTGLSFISPLCLAIDYNLCTIYVSDSVTNEITSITFDGKVMATYKDDQLTNPLHMAVDGTGSIYVCGRQSNNVTKLSQDLKKDAEILDKNDVTNPVSVAFCEQRNRLYVAMKKETVLKVYKIKKI